MSKPIFKTFYTEAPVSTNVDIESIEKNGYTQKFKITDESVDASGDIVYSDGVEFDKYLKNPVVFWEHEKKMKPIGRAESVYKTDDGWYADIHFPPKAVDEFANSVAKSVAYGLIRGTSIGFKPKKYNKSYETGRNYDFKNVSIAEISITSLPQNENALASKSVNEEFLMEEKFEEFKEVIEKSLGEIKDLVAKSNEIQVITNAEPETPALTAEQVSEMIKEQIGLALAQTEKEQPEVTKEAVAALTMTEEDLQKIVDESFQAGFNAAKKEGVN